VRVSINRRDDRDDLVTFNAGPCSLGLCAVADLRRLGDGRVPVSAEPVCNDRCNIV
jgi:hypothetical protein